jgi:uncharacterized protein (DUF697 family)
MRPGEQNTMNSNVDRVVRRTSVLTAALGVILSPIPLADELLLLPIYGVMVARIGKAHGLSSGQIPWKPVVATAVAGLAARAAVNVTVSYIPGVAAVANAVSAVALTRFFGRYVDGACREPASARALSIQDILAALRTLRRSRDSQAAAA